MADQAMTSQTRDLRSAFAQASSSVPMTLNAVGSGPSSNTPNLHLNHGQSQQIDVLLHEVLTSVNLDPLPPSVPSMMIAAESLARTTLDNFRTLSAELNLHRSIFKCCYSAGGFFDNILWQSYLARLTLIHKSLEVGMLVALQAMLGQIRLWLQVGCASPMVGPTFLAGLPQYRARLHNLVSIGQQVQQALRGMILPQAEALQQDTRLMQEVFQKLNAVETDVRVGQQSQNFPQAFRIPDSDDDVDIQTASQSLDDGHSICPASQVFTRAANMQPNHDSHQISHPPNPYGSERNIEDEGSFAVVEGLDSEDWKDLINWDDDIDAS